MLRIKDDTFCNICLLCRRNTRDVMNCYRCLYQKMEYTQICDNLVNLTKCGPTKQLCN